jgi:hypothetical protein
VVDLPEVFRQVGDLFVDPFNSKPENERRARVKRPIKITIGAAVGAVLGFSYYYFVGCRTGGCPITSNPYISIVYGSAIGLLVSWGKDTPSKKSTS